MTALGDSTQALSIATLDPFFQRERRGGAREAEREKIKDLLRLHLVGGVRSRRQLGRAIGCSGSTAAKNINDLLSIPKPEVEDKHSVHFLVYEFVEFYVKANREVPEEVIRILRKDVLLMPGGKERSSERVLSETERHAFLHGLSAVCSTPVRYHTLLVCFRTGRTSMGMLNVDERIAERVLNHSMGEIIEAHRFAKITGG